MCMLASLQGLLCGLEYALHLFNLNMCYKYCQLYINEIIVQYYFVCFSQQYFNVKILKMTNEHQLELLSETIKFNSVYIECAYYDTLLTLATYLVAV